MKNKRSTVGQYIFDGLGDTEDAYEHIEELIPLIGEMVIFFNALESDLDHLICESISDRSDQKGLIVLHNMKYLPKIELYERFICERSLIYGWNSDDYNDLIGKLKECGTLRNRVVHANWHNTDDEKYTQIRIKMTKQGLEHELWQFSTDSMHQVIKKIINTREILEDFEEECLNKITEWNNKIYEENKDK